MDDLDPFAEIERAAKRLSDEEQAAKAVSNARTALVLGRDAKSAFFASLALRLDPKPDWDVPTAATDGRDLLYNPAWVLGLPAAKRLGTMGHEVLHCAMGHHTQGHDLDPMRRNIAMDLAINPILLEAGFQLPDDGCVPGQPGPYKDLPPGLSWREYYDLLPDKKGGDEDGDDEGKGSPDPGGCGTTKKPGDGSQADCKTSLEKWKNHVTQAQTLAERRGRLPGGLGRAITDALAPKVDWREVLREFVSAHSRNDYSWRPPNKRYVAAGLYLPSTRSEELGDVVIAVDTSGSIGPEVLDRFASEVQSILDNFGCRLTILYHDSEVAHVQVWQSSDGPLTLEPRGGGGTDHKPVFEWVEESGEVPTCMVCLTDMYSSFPDKGPDYPVLWASTTKGKEAPFGQLVEVGD